MLHLGSFASRASPCSGSALVTLRWVQDLTDEAALLLADVPLAKGVGCHCQQSSLQLPAGVVAEQSSVSAPSFQGAFDHRMKTWQRWQDAQTMLQKKREMEARLLWANKPDKLQQAKEEISEVGGEELPGSLLSSFPLCSAAEQ